jgi:hypothetical protein
MFGSVGLFVAALSTGDQLLVGLAALYATILTPVGVYLDRYRRSVKVVYQPDGYAKKFADAFSEAFAELRKCRAIWSIRSEGHTSDWKRHAGCNTLVKRQRIYLQHKRPACIRGRVTFPAIAIGSDELFFSPDAVLLVTSSSVAALHYRDLELSNHRTRFVEDDAVPGDAMVVDQTWRFVAKNGGPDRRFNGNRQLPVCLYGEMSFGSAGGLRGKIQFSNASAGDLFAKVVSVLASLDSSNLDSKSIVALKKPTRTPTVLFCCCSIALAGLLGLATFAPWKLPLSEPPKAVTQSERPKLTQPKNDGKASVGSVGEQKRSVEPIRKPVGEPLVIAPPGISIKADTPVRSVTSVPLPRPRPKSPTNRL